MEELKQRLGRYGIPYQAYYSLNDISKYTDYPLRNVQRLITPSKGEGKLKAEPTNPSEYRSPLVVKAADLVEFLESDRQLENYYFRKLKKLLVDQGIPFQTFLRDSIRKLEGKS